MAHQAAVPGDRAVIDRIVDGSSAVLLVGPEEHERIVAASMLPEDAREGVWVVVDASTDPVTVIAVDHQRTADRAERIEQQLEQIRERQQGGRFRRP